MKQITEDYCSPKISQLLQEKGFDIPCDSYYTYFESNVTLYKGHLPEFSDSNINHNKFSDRTSRPSQSLALKWLREVHNIVLDIAFEANKGWTFYVSRLITETLSDGSTCIVDILHFVWSDDVQQPYYKEHEQAVESAIKYTLENLI